MSLRSARTSTICFRVPGDVVAIVREESCPGHSGTLARRSLASEVIAGVTPANTVPPSSLVAIAEATESACTFERGTENVISYSLSPIFVTAASGTSNDEREEKTIPLALVSCGFDSTRTETVASPSGRSRALAVREFKIIEQVRRQM